MYVSIHAYTHVYACMYVSILILCGLPQRSYNNKFHSAHAYHVSTTCKLCSVRDAAMNKNSWKTTRVEHACNLKKAMNRLIKHQMW